MEDDIFTLATMSETDNGKIDSVNDASNDNETADERARDTNTQVPALEPPANQTAKSSRPVCPVCHRPTPQACVCHALPTPRLRFSSCQCIVLQHPHEVKRKNRSMPLIELCLEESAVLNYNQGTSKSDGRHATKNADNLQPKTSSATRDNDASSKDNKYDSNYIDTDKSVDAKIDTSHISLCLMVGRRFGSAAPLSDLIDPQSTVWLVFPDPHAISLSQALDQWRPTKTKLVLVFIDATWKHALEMHTANLKNKVYPPNMQIVQLSDLPDSRFDIRRPPADNQWSTAEALAYVVSRVEDNAGLYASMIKPLDCMVQQWQSHYTSSKVREKKRKAATS
jgi:DTW domain-containing protein YfiP